jgi:mannitol-1-phosphate 5-dehydrogenase
LADKQAVMFGAGNIGRGFLGQLFYESGYHTTFVDVQDTLVDALNARGEYPLRIVDDTSTNVTIRNVSAINARDSDGVAEALAGADIAATAVGVHVMPAIAAALASGIARRFERSNAAPLDIIVCENLIGAGPFMRSRVRESLDPRFHNVLESSVGFVEASIGRMVPVLTAELIAEDPLLIEVEAYRDLPVDRAGFRGPIPPIVSLQAKDNFGAYVERKLFVHNLGHAATAYLGYQRGHSYIWQAIEDTEVRGIVEGAMAETCLGLYRKHGMPLDDLTAHAADLRRRFANKALGDQITRVARDPIRKLGPNDRLIGAVHMCLDQGVPPLNVVKAIRAAIQYDNPEDPASQTIQAIRRERGDATVLREIGGVGEGDALLEMMGLRAEG